MKIGTHDLHLHSIAVHFTNALYPVAVFFLILSHFYKQDLCLFTYFHLMILATISVPISYATGLIEWQQKYKGAKVKIFIHKYRYGILLFLLGTSCTLWYGLYPDIMMESGGLRVLFLALNISLLPPTVYLGTLGGRLVFGSAH